MKKFRNVQETQQKLVDEAQAQLNASMETFTETVNAELAEFEHIKDSTDVPCILKDL